MRIFLTILVFAGLLLFGCADAQFKDSAKIIKDIEYITALNSDWILKKDTTKNNEYYLQKADTGIISVGEIVNIEFLTHQKIKYLKLTSEHVSSKPETIEYKLYVDDIFVGKYFGNHTIGISKPVKSMRLVLVKTNQQNIIKGWDNKFNYSLITQNKGAINWKLKLMIGFDKKSPIQFKRFGTQKYVIPNKIRIKEYHNKFDFVNKQSIMVLQERTGKFVYENSIRFKSDGKFQIQQIKADRNKKTHIYDFYYRGNWVAKRLGRKKIQLILKGTVSGLIEGKISKRSSYQLNTYADSLGVRGKGILNGFYMDLPDWAMLNLQNFNSDLIIDIPYASTNNITKTKLYSCNECYLRYRVIKDLLRIQAFFKQKGLRVKLLDCYRPWEVQKVLYEAFPISGYVADPAGGSIHNRGTAVDLTLVDKTGKELDMGTQYDDLSFKSNQGYIGFSDTITKNRKLLRETMNAFNFVTIRLEWWHYNHSDARKYRILNDQFPCYNE